MKAMQRAAIGMMAALFACALRVYADPGMQGIAQAPADPVSCQWTRETAPERVRSPVQMDVHAAYRIFAFKSDGTVGYRVRTEFPYAAFLSYTIYDKALVHAALIDHDIVPDAGSANPFVANALIHEADRRYTVTLLPEGAVAGESTPNPIFMPPLRRPSDVAIVVFVQRIYLPEPGRDRYGDIVAPTIEPFLVSDPATPAACPGEEVGDIADDFGNVAIPFSQSPLPRDGKIAFYRPPVADVPFADGDGLQDKHDCTGYLMATVFADRLAVIHLPKVPAFFDNTDIGPTTRFVPPADVRYLSLGSYGASVMGVLENENVAGPDIRKLSDGSATFVAIPLGLSLPEAVAVIHTAEELGYNPMPLAAYGPLIAGRDDGQQINPFLIYRNKVAGDGFSGNIKNVACFQGTSFSHAPQKYAASPANMGEFAPTGVECSVAEFVHGRCGQDFGASRR